MKAIGFACEPRTLLFPDTMPADIDATLPLPRLSPVTGREASLSAAVIDSQGIKTTEIGIAGLCQQLGKRQSVVGHRVLVRFGVGCRNTTLAAGAGDHLKPGGGGKPTRNDQRISNTSADATRRADG